MKRDLFVVSKFASMFNKIILLIGLISRLPIAFDTFSNLNHQWKVEAESQQETKRKIEKVVHHLRLEHRVDSFNHTNGTNCYSPYDYQQNWHQCFSAIGQLAPIVSLEAQPQNTRPQRLLLLYPVVIGSNAYSIWYSYWSMSLRACRLGASVWPKGYIC